MLSSVGPVRMGWADRRCDCDLRKGYGEKMEGVERESLYRPHEGGFSGVGRIVLCTNLNIDILKGHVIQAQRHTLNRFQIRF